MDDPASFVERRSLARTDYGRRQHHDAIYALARAAERHDPDTGDHVVRIRLIVERIADAMGLDDAADLGYDAMLHDVGKLTVPVEILRKPDGLSKDERVVMEGHTLEGEQVLAGTAALARAARIARCHHECWDGSGYPDGLRGDAIPIEARITAVADVLDALVAERPYKAAWSYRDAIEAVVKLAGTQLDPTVVAALERCDTEGILPGMFEKTGENRG